jgi:hypothetical protein
MPVDRTNCSGPLGSSDCYARLFRGFLSRLPGGRPRGCLAGPPLPLSPVTAEGGAPWAVPDGGPLPRTATLSRVLLGNALR